MSAAFNKTPDRDERAAFWCLSLLEGALTTADQAAFDRWLAEPDNARAFAETTDVWNALDQVSDRPDIISLRSSALEMFRRENRRRWTRQVAPRWLWGGAVAASLALAAVLAILLYTPTHIFRTAIGERQLAILEDGSKLSLDADTQVDVRMERGRRDLVLVRGRAKFDVAKDPLRPFSVAAGDKIVVATGTAFTVEMLDRRVHVLLYEGHVAVLDRDSHAPVPRTGSRAGSKATADQMLLPGRELVMPLGATSGTVEPADVPQSLSWESGQLMFDDEPLVSAVARVNRYSKEQVRIGDAGAAAAHVSGVFTAGDTDAFVEAVTALAPVRATRGNGEITLRRR
jgi:transmembrane sensor